MADFVEAPFSDEQIQLLNEFQTGTGKSFPGHPFTCRDRGDGRHGDEGGDTGVLIATPDGWVCPHCDYTQAWAHAGMATRPSIPHESLLAEFFARGMGNPDRIDRILARYLQLEEQGKTGAAQMVKSLRCRAAEVAANSSSQPNTDEPRETP